jgi:hypothetical protein
METEHAVVALSGLNIAGALIQILGVGLALFGALRAWKEFGDEGFADPVLMPIRRAGQRLSAALERVIRRLLRRRIHLEGRARVATGAGGVMIRGRKQFRVLPGDLDPSLAVVELDERTRELMGLSSDLKDRFDDEQTRREQETTQLGDRLEKTRKELWERDRDIARSGIRLEFLGLFFVLVGFVLQTQPFV